MKKLQHVLMIGAVASLSIFISYNKDDDGGDSTDARDEQGEAISGSWTVTSATFNNDPRPDWEGATVTFTYDNASDEGTYVVSGVPTTEEGENAAEVLGADGAQVSWSFAGENQTNSIVRESDGVSMTTTVSASSLTLSFSLTGVERIAGFDGNWKFELSAD